MEPSRRAGAAVPVPAASANASSAPAVPAFAIFNPPRDAKVGLHARLQPVLPEGKVPAHGLDLRSGLTSYDFAMQIQPRQATRLGLRVSPGQSIDGSQSFAVLSHVTASPGGTRCAPASSSGAYRPPFLQSAGSARDLRALSLADGCVTTPPPNASFSDGFGQPCSAARLACRSFAMLTLLHRPRACPVFRLW